MFLKPRPRRAAAIVEADGIVVRSTGVTAVRKISTGTCSIDLDPDINAAKTIPVATPRGGAPWNTAIFIGTHQGCGDAARSFRVFTDNTTRADPWTPPFHVVD
ncbi:hypothetical protein [Actinomadura kijaniata]|uniref:hypothetical protein n=1 Tax=Actinomadura kijaniata TaxID=46161 RepID=UPI00082B13B1|nr:hypothetical protein [Actinomadura kijaniata]